LPWDVERDAQTGLSVLEQVVESFIGLFRRAESGVLAKSPRAAAVHRRVDTARKRVFTRITDPLWVRFVHVGWRIDRSDLDAGRREESRFSFGLFLDGRAVGVV
jgi:hypothetical protein